ncbi:hypothetical protein MCERE85_01415 [Candidatus Nanopelagicaceae bacterium]
MKQAYVTVILPFSGKVPSAQEINTLDKALKTTTRHHEIILISVFDSSSNNFNNVDLFGPLSIVYTNSISSQNSSRIAAFGRAVGDFIIEWQGTIGELNEDIILELLDPTNHGFELVEFESEFQTSSSRAFYKFANTLRSSKMPVRKTVSRVYSRRALAQVLLGFSFEPQINVLCAELPVQRAIRTIRVDFATNQSFRNRLGEGMSLLAKGSRFGTVVPLALATISASFGVFVALYALTLYLVSGKSPEGWTTLMIATGMGQASILALIGMTWSRIDALSKGLSRSKDATAEVTVYPPNL